MAKISGNISADARLIIVDETEWLVESNTTETGGTFEVTGLTSGAKTVISRAASGECIGYGGVGPIVPIGNFTDYKFWDSYTYIGQQNNQPIFAYGAQHGGVHSLMTNYDWRMQRGNEFNVATAIRLTLKKISVETPDVTTIDNIAVIGRDGGGEAQFPQIGYVDSGLTIGNSGNVVTIPLTMTGTPPIQLWEIQLVTNGQHSDFYIEKIEFVNVEAEDGWIQGGAIWVYNPAALNDRWSAGANISWQSASDNRGYFLANMAEFNVNAILQVNGSWASGLRPLQAKITYQSDIESADPFAIEFEFRSSDNTILADVGFGGNNSHTNHTIDLDFTDYEEDKDIHQLRFFCHPGQEGDPQILMNIRIKEIVFFYA